MMINVLFVDDEPNILGGLKRMLRPMHREWDMSFAEGSLQALRLLGEKNFDVVISDMKMPGMDGSEFLYQVRNNFPQTVRIILSGYSEKDMIMKSVGTAHQYISKPCDSETLKETVSRACALRDLLTSDKIRRLVSQIHTVPSLPTLYQELMRELNQPDPKMQKIGAIVKKDIGMTVKILQIINSAFFGLRRNISDASEAIGFLGLDTVSALTLSIGVFEQFETKNGTDSIPGELWNHSMAVAMTAKKIALSVDKETANDAFTAGLLHDIGEVVLAVNLPEQFAKVKEMMTCEQISQRQAELAVFETTHSEVGAYLIGLWGLPRSIVEAVAFHDFPNKFQTGLFSALTAVHVSNIFHENKDQDVCSEPENHFDVEFLGKLGLVKELPKWRDEFMTDF
jgi:HD-like signal output (HDOD) protein